MIKNGKQADNLAQYPGWSIKNILVNRDEDKWRFPSAQIMLSPIVVKLHRRSYGFFFQVGGRVATLILPTCV